MKKYIQSELLKNQKSFAVKMLVLIPIICVTLAIFLMGGTYVQVLSYNWWYLLFLPFILVYVSAYLIRHDRKKNFHGLFGLIENKANLGYGKVLATTIYLIVASGVFGVLISVVGCVLEMQIGIMANFLASIVLTITYAWQIPFFMLLSMKINMFVSILVSVICNFGIACLCATGDGWWIPFAIPARMMCHILGILPNGLSVEDRGGLGGNAIVVIGILITVFLYLIMTLILGRKCTKLEAS